MNLSYHSTYRYFNTIRKILFHVMASLAQMERELIIERTKAGLNAAKKLGRVSGRKRKMTDNKLASAKKLLESGTLLTY